MQKGISACLLYLTDWGWVPTDRNAHSAAQEWSVLLPHVKKHQ